MAEAQAAGQDREYETIFILRPNTTRESSESISTRLAEVVARDGGKLTRVESWGRRRLAYPVEKQKRGVYVYMRFLGRGGLVSEVERNLRLLDDVLKYQTVKIRDEVARDTVQVAPEDVKFEYVEPATEPEDDSLARELGLEDRPDRDEHKRHGFDEEAEALAEMGEGGLDDDEDDE